MVNRKEIFSIPNILGYFRILLIPFIVNSYMVAETVRDYSVTAVLVGVSSITDLFDGLIARKFDMVTELGKLIDPVADKLTQAALILCFALKNNHMRYLLALYVAKEIFMLAAGLIVLRHNGRRLNGARWFGKASTALVYGVMFLFFLRPIFFSTMTAALENSLIGLCAAALFGTLLLYIPVFVKLYQE